MSASLRRWLPWLLVVMLALSFVLLGAGADLDYVIPKRLTRLLAIIIGGSCVALSSLIFQTLVGNRILTPAVMGYEAVYLLWQTLLLQIVGTGGMVMLAGSGNFLSCVLLMLGYSWALQRWLLRDGGHDVQKLLLCGLVLGLLIGSISQFLQLRISPGEFAVLQGHSVTSFNRARPQNLLLAGSALLLIALLTRRSLAVLDVLTFGREQAISLGVDHDRQLRVQLALVAILVAVSTSLVGPVAFMGIFIANITVAIAPDSRHRTLLPLGCVIATITFLLAQLMVEHIFNYRTTVGILVNMVCGSYFLALMLRKRAQL